MRALSTLASAALLSIASAPAAIRGAEPEAGPPLVREGWGIEDGLPQSSITSILQTPDGYVWLATFGGLVRFDGVAFREFGPAHSAGMTSPRLLALAADRAGGLLLGTEDRGVLRFDGERFETVVAAAALPGVVVRSLAIAPDGEVWVGTNGGVARLDGGRVAAVYDEAAGLVGREAIALAARAEGGIWVGTERGLSAIDEGGVVHLGRVDSRLEEPVLALAPAPDGALWILAPERAYLLRDARVERALARRPGPDFAGAVLVDAGGRLWVAGASVEREGGAGSLELVAGESELGSAVQRDLHLDAEGGVWLGSDGGGLHRFRPARARTLSAADGVPAGSVTAVLEDADGVVWTAAQCGGVARSTGGRFEPVLAGGRPFTCVSSLLVDRRGALWVGDGGLARWDGHELTRFGVDEGVPGGGVQALLEDRDGRVWVGTNEGLARQQGERFVVLDERDGLVHRRVRELLEGRDGAIWVGTVGGLSRFRDGRFESWRSGVELPPASVRALYESADGTLWIGTYGAGLGRLRNGRLAFATTSQGLVDNVVSGILEDGQAGLWLSGNRGVSRLPRVALDALLDGRAASVAPLALRARDGMLSAECNGGSQPSALLARDGRLWFPTVRGLVVIDPADLSLRPPPPPVRIEEIRVGGRRVGLASQVEVPPNGDVEIDYTAFSFTAPHDLRFRFRISGFDAEWIEAGARRTAYYRHVPPGSYRFEVVAAGAGGLWPASGAELPLRFRPRFYQTAWFRLAAAAALVAAGAALQQARLRRARRHQRELERQVGERTADLTREHRRTEQHLRLLQRQDEELKALNRNLARMVREQTDELVETRDAAVLALARLAELRDGTTGVHLDRIAAYTRRLAQAVASGPYGSLDEETIELYARSSQLHDIGKVAIPDAILNKPGFLSEEERAVIRTHPLVGGDTLRSVMERYGSQSFLATATEIAYCHHERWDGRGYPRGLAGEAIPLPARIVALVDVFDALTSERPYKPPLPHEEAVAIIVGERGRHFDPHLVDAFLAIEHEFPAIRAKLAA